MNQILNYINLFIILLIIIYCLYNININDSTSNTIKNNPLFLSFGIVLSFFIGCYISALIIDKNDFFIDKYCGILYLLAIGIILLISNIIIFKKEKILQYISGKKFSKIGIIMLVGIGSLIFGFIDNFGMRLGTEALDNVFIQGFLGPLSKHNQFNDYRKNIQDNFKIINHWVEKDWRKVLNHVLRFKDEISKNKKMKDLTNAIQSMNCSPLIIPKNILKDRSLTNDYVDNIRNKYDVIYDSKAMLGNTFSNFCAALLGAGIIGIITYLTAFDDVNIGDNNKDNFVNMIEKFGPLLEAFFITIGCLIPIFLNIAMKTSKYDNNNIYSWLLVALFIVTIILIMYFSYKNITLLTTKNKINGLKNTLMDIKTRYKINNNEDKILNDKINQFIDNL